MTKFKDYHYITIELYKDFNRDYNKSYNKNCDPHRCIKASTSLYYSIKQKNLTDCLQALELLGYSQEQSVVTLAAVQLVAGLGGVA